MKKKYSFWQKTKVYYRFLREREGYGIRTVCDFCESDKIDKLNGKSSSLNNSESHYEASYKCVNCGASGSIYEIWTKR